MNYHNFNTWHIFKKNTLCTFVEANKQDDIIWIISRGSVIEPCGTPFWVLFFSVICRFLHPGKLRFLFKILQVRHLKAVKCVLLFFWHRDMLISAVKLDFLTLTHLGGLWWTLVELQHLVFSSVGCCGQSERAAVWPQLSVCRGFPSHIQECHTVSGDTLSASPPRPSPSLFVGFPACLSVVFGRPACSLSLSDPRTAAQSASSWHACLCALLHT